MGRLLAIALGLGAAGLALGRSASAHAQPDCVASPSGAHSYWVTVSPLAGYVAAYDVHVSTGGSCDPAARVGTILLHSTHRLAITDGGVLVQVLAPRTSHRDWSIVALYALVPGEREPRTTRLSLDALPGTEVLRGTVRASIDGGAVRFVGRDGELSIPFAELEALAER